jgi:hypothetical protein
VKVFEESSPLRVLVQHCVCETDDLTTLVGNDRALIRPAGMKATRPDLPTFGDDGAVEVRIQVRAAIVPTPAVGVECGNTTGIVFARRPVTHNLRKRPLFEGGTGQMALLIVGTTPVSTGIAQEPLTGWSGWPPLP